MKADEIIRIEKSQQDVIHKQYDTRNYCETENNSYKPIIVGVQDFKTQFY